MSSATEGFRLSAQQRRAWSASRRSPSRAWCAVEIDGPLNAAELREAAAGLVNAHEILRTTFPRRTGLRFPFQTVAASGAVDWSERELPGEAADAVERLAAEDAALPVDLEKGPNFRARLARLGPSRHLLFLSLPRLSADARTMHFLAAALAKSYAGESPEESEGGAIQYVDFAQWQEDLLESGDEAAQAGRARWRRPGGDPAGRPAGTKRPLEAETTATFELPSDTVEAIDALVGSGLPQTSLRSVLIAALQVVLWRSRGEPDVAVWNVHPGRKLDELHDALGPFAQAIPALGRIEGNPPFSDVVRAVSEELRENEEWEEYFVVEDDADPAVSLTSGAPAFELVERPPLVAASGVSFRIVGESRDASAGNPEVACVREGNRIRVTIHASRPGDWFSSAAALAERLETLLPAAVRNPDRPVGALPILSARERLRVVEEFNRTAAAFPETRAIHELFEEQVERTPDRTALVFDGAALTYREVNRRANALAHRLIERGVHPDTPVGLAVERSSDMIVALLGILKSGGAYLPLNPEHPPARLAFQLAQAGAKFAVTEPGAGDLGDFAGERIAIDAALFDAAERPNPGRRAGPSHLAYILYTSGSTGAPKGVEVGHRSLVNYAHFIARTLLGIAADGSPLAFATVSTMSADLGNTAIFPALISGGCLHVVSYGTAMEGERFAAYCDAHPIDVLKIVPSHFAALLAGGGSRILPRRALILGGEALPWELVDRIEALGGTAEIVNHYGPTEATVGALTYRLEKGKPRPDSRTVPIGSPIANSRALIRDPFGSPVPVGVPGEIFIGGAGLARGYVNQPAETAARFVPDLFDGGSLLYATGDRARFLPDGAVEYLGRADDQVKIRGFRIEPGEVRAVLATHPAVAEAAVIARGDSGGERRLVAYVVTRRGSAVSAEELRAWARTRLPDYMLPSAAVFLKSLPLTPNGKLDRDALPAPEDSSSAKAYVAPRTPAEQTIAPVWAELLRVDRVGVDDDFFELGGHSLLLTQVVSRLRKLFQRDLPIRWLFECSTVAKLAARIDAAEREDLARLLDEIEGLPEGETGGSERGNEPPVRA